MKKIIYIFMGFFCLLLGIIGAFLPLMPTTIFIIMAAYFFARSSETLYNKLMSHSHFGPIIHNWQTHRSMPKKAKVIAISSTILGSCIPLFSPIHPTVKVFIFLTMVVLVVILIKIKTTESIQWDKESL